MCGRFALTATPDQTAAFLGVTELEEFPARYNIAPTQPVLAATAGPPREPGSNLPDRQAMLVRWGLIPAWVKDTREFPLLINARSESVLEKASFKTAMRHRRALIPASGFYEWQQSGGKKGQPYWIRPRRGGMVAFACLIETYSEPGGSEMDTGAIITTQANSGIAHIHDRMPVVIGERDFTRWLDCRTQEPRDVLDLLKPVEPDFFEAIPVSDLVNKVANTGPEIQERGIVAPQPEKTGRQKPGANEDQMSLF
ncbi:MAG: SOS response-associated peptidase [Mesorhizobium sp.]|uniref:SOS response-associated peptidase n=1 Tax=Mesorhizobium sp. TaxID=1871066 RepID=UPI001AC5F65D|nr:SOS response-associated peptidase [Mesorhizobium sp.]MBN9221166.1 SOS response-associated peptidase [Mesorhizobium sp.]